MKVKLIHTINYLRQEGGRYCLFQDMDLNKGLFTVRKVMMMQHYVAQSIQDNIKRISTKFKSEILDDT